MNRIRVIAVGKTKEPWLDEGLDKFRKRLKPYTKLEETILAVGKGSRDEVKTSEASAILDQLSNSDYVVVLDELGKEFSSKKFADYINQLGVQGTSSITFVIGGAFGVSEDVLNRANAVIRLSAMTFTHQMVRVILLEQVYRAFSIIRGEKYHH